MTDQFNDSSDADFEEVVRRAAQELTRGTVPAPTYHDAWRVGRRRRTIKRAGLAAAAACVLVAAIGVNLGRFPGPAGSEVDDVASTAAPTAVTADSPATEIPAATVVVTTPPLPPVGTEDSDPFAEEPELDESTAASSAAIEEPDQVEPPRDPSSDSASDAATTDVTGVAPVPTNTVEPTTEAASPAAPTVAATPNPTPTPTPADQRTPEPLPTATSEPTTAIAPPVTTPDPTGSFDTGVAPELTPEPTADPTTDEPAPTATPTVESETDPEPDGLPSGLPAPQQSAPADAVILDPAPNAAGNLACDSSGDGEADATCSLLTDYPCTSQTEAEPGYSAVDTDGDGTLDTCTALDITQCDTTGDGMGDVPCVIEVVAPARDADS